MAAACERDGGDADHDDGDGGRGEAMVMDGRVLMVLLVMAMAG